MGESIFRKTQVAFMFGDVNPKTKLCHFMDDNPKL